MVKQYLLVGSFLCCFHWATGQVAVFGGNQYQTFSSAGTTNGPSTDGMYTMVASVGQPIAVSSPVLTQTQAGILSAASAGVLNPVVGQLIITPTLLTSFKPGASFSVHVTDAAAISKTLLHYKPITASPDQFDSTVLLSTSSSPNDKTYSQTISNTAWYDQMGIEYFYTATDANGKSKRDPIAGSFYSSLSTSPLPLSALTTLPSALHYKIVAFPYDSASTSWRAADVFKVGNDKSAARMFHWNTASKKYLEFANGEFSTLVRGNGYWLLYATPPTLSVSNVVAPPENRSQLFTVTLAAKSWNQIGNPYPVPLRWSDVLALDANHGVDPNELSKLNIYNGSSYDSASNSTLAPFEGGFIYNFSTANISLQLPFQGQTQVGGRIVAAPTNIGETAWNVFLHIAQQEQSENLIAGFGMNPGSTQGPDRHDNFNPPPIVAMPEVDFHHSDYPDIDFGNDIVSPQDSYQWQFTTRGIEGQESRLTWNTAIESAGRQLILFEPASLRVIDMLTTHQYTFTQSTHSAFSICYGDDAMSLIRPSGLSMTGPFPNPTLQNRTTVFRVAIPDAFQNAVASLQIFNGTGQPVGTYTLQTAPGLHDLSWVFPPEQASGIYLYRLRVYDSATSKIYTGKLIVP